jgi:hypothetical protein
VVSANATTYSYLARIASANTSLEQSFTFFNAPTKGDFFGLAYTVAAGAVKWSVNLTADSAGAAGGVTLRYLLLLREANASDNATDNRTGVVRLLNVPQANTTTYIVPFLQGSVVAKVEVFDVALVDGDDFRYITHDVVATGTDYELVLRFPGFNRSLLYDPSIGLGVLLGESHNQGDGGGGNDSAALIVAVAVAVPVAVLAVILVIGGVIGVGWWRRRRIQANGGSVNFGSDDTHSHEQQL